ncbi:TetR family transcriptional regulator [Mycolicibacter minnesotensis]|uniref:TetR family transcriptional regulator n=1 Tax=Mycolicibacter minnesotensis TaxID=1118379 RepID=A0A7I7R729_9MYCO|nr:TetR/AcrR family transcriptional regulator [Mycolicibacter minnesotensis]ORB00816.1 TetR family transcriptional regulator [Mycolicibacter minnesotensis]BBY34473.1 putative HTH-type transcriptional regulator [Mycolicibacter minnesotensis]
MARTQQERREATVAGLLDASIATIAEIGYARASAKVIAARAGVSDGALFRHFGTMGDFMAATGQEVLRRQLELIGKQVAAIPADGPALETVLTLLRDLTANSNNAVFYELLIAARTDEKLRSTLSEVLDEYSAKIYDTARGFPGADAFPAELFPNVVALLTNTFDGAAIVRAVRPQPEIEANRIPLLLALLQGQAQAPRVV